MCQAEGYKEKSEGEIMFFTEKVKLFNQNIENDFNKRRWELYEIGEKIKLTNTRLVLNSGSSLGTRLQQTYSLGGIQFLRLLPKRSRKAKI